MLPPDHLTIATFSLPLVELAEGAIAELQLTLYCNWGATVDCRRLNGERRYGRLNRRYAATSALRQRLAVRETLMHMY